MNADALFEALNLPNQTLVNKRVPKKLLIENGAPTPADKRYINNDIDKLTWEAVLKSSTIGVSEYRDASHEYLEIAVLRMILRSDSKAVRLMELVHRAVPYPVLLITEYAGYTSLSTANKRLSQSEADKVVLEDSIAEAHWENDTVLTYLQQFHPAVDIEKQPHSNMYDIYQAWTDTILAFNAANLTGNYTLFSDLKKRTDRQEALRQIERLKAEMLRIRSAAKKEKQMSRRVQLNMELKRAEAAHASALMKL